MEQIDEKLLSKAKLDFINEMNKTIILGGFLSESQLRLLKKAHKNFKKIN